MDGGAEVSAVSWACARPREPRHLSFLPLQASTWGAVVDLTTFSSALQTQVRGFFLCFISTTQYTTLPLLISWYLIVIDFFKDCCTARVHSLPGSWNTLEYCPVT